MTWFAPVSAPPADVSFAVRSLANRQREILVLRERCGLSYDQIARVLHIPGEQVAADLWIARRQVLEQLADVDMNSTPEALA